MSVAVITCVYNEAYNLPRWRAWYGAAFGEANLFVVDQSSTDGSTFDLGVCNRICVPRRPLDEVARADFMSRLHGMLLHHYDVVILTDCDELLVPDPAKYSGLADFVERMSGDHVTAVGLNLIQILTEEAPLDSQRPLLGQRSVVGFTPWMCKTLISRVPTRWLPGFHACDLPTAFDPDLFLFHTKLADFDAALRRHRINQQTQWSDQAIEQGHGGHHRVDQRRFVEDYFLMPIQWINQGHVQDFDFTRDIAAYHEVLASHQDFLQSDRWGMWFARVPERFHDKF